MSNAAWVLAGHGAYVGSQAVFMILLVRNFTPAVVGYVALGVAIAEPIIKLCNLNLRIVIATDLKNQFEFSQYFWFRMLSSSVALFVITGIATMIGENTLAFVDMIYVAVFRCSEAISDIFYGLYQKNESMQHIGVSYTLKAAAIALLLVVSVCFVQYVLLFLSVQVVVSLMVTVFYDYRVTKRRFIGYLIGKQTVTQELVSAGAALFQLGLPLGIALSLENFIFNIPRYNLNAFASAYELGIFAALMYFYSVGSVLLYSFRTAALPRLTKYYQCEQTGYFLMLTGKMIALSWVVVLAALCLIPYAGDFFLTILYTDKYSLYSSYLYWVLLTCGFGFSASILSSAIEATRQFKVILKIKVCMLFIGATLGVLLVSTYGLAGAFYTSVMITICHVIISAVVLANMVKQ